MNNEKIIKLLGTFFVVVSSLKVILNAKGIWWSLEGLFRPSSFSTIQEYLFFSVTSLFFLIALPVATLMAGVGLIKIRKSGWRLAMIVATVTFISSLYGTINFAILSYRFRNMPIPKIPEEAHVEVVSMWPTYISALASLLFIMLLTRSSIKNAFNR